MFSALGALDCDNEQKVRAKAGSAINQKFQGLEGLVRRQAQKEAMLKPKDSTAGTSIAFRSRICAAQKRTWVMGPDVSFDMNVDGYRPELKERTFTLFTLGLDPAGWLLLLQSSRSVDSACPQSLPCPEASNSRKPSPAPEEN